MSETKPYHSIVQHYETCLQQHGSGHKAVDWPNESDAQTRYKVMLEVAQNDTRDSLSLLDFGCGLGALYQFIREQEADRRINYHGLDISQLFIDRCREKYPDINWYCEDVLTSGNTTSFDYIVLNGVFTEKRELQYSAMFDYFKQLTKTVFARTTTGMAFNVMSPDVQWSRLDLFHLSFDLLTDFLTKEVTRNFIIRNDYGLYEYTVYVYR